MLQKFHQFTPEFVRDLQQMWREWKLARGGRPRKDRFAPQQRHVDYGRTVAIDETYPTAASGANTFAFVFVDFGFAEEEGVQELTLANRTAGYWGVGKAGNNAYIPEHTLCEVVRLWNGKYILTPLTPSSLYGGLVAGTAETTNGEIIDFTAELPASGVTVSAADDKITILTAGNYEVHYTGSSTSPSDDDGINVQVQKNGSGAGFDYGRPLSVFAGKKCPWAFSSILTLAAEDYLQLFFGASGLVVTHQNVHFWVHYLGPLPAVEEEEEEE